MKVLEVGEGAARPTIAGGSQLVTDQGTPATSGFPSGCIWGICQQARCLHGVTRFLVQ